MSKIIEMISEEDIRKVVKEEMGSAIDSLKKEMKGEDKPMTRQEAADYIGISLPTLDKLIKEGVVKATKRKGVPVRIWMSDILKAFGK